MMDYSEWMRKLFSFPGRGLQTFEAFQRLDQRLGAPHRAFRSIHVGGTNGKGSVATKIAVALQESGYRVGLYTSPHISSVRERIAINGEIISEASVLEHLPFLFKRLQGEIVSFFDLLTALAFLYFRASQVDWAVVEVGLGGRLDATNVIMPELAVLTTIGYDHRELLGYHLEEIAREKGGIVKPGVPLIVGPSAAPYFPSAHLRVPLREGFYDRENSAIAHAALLSLGVAEKAIAKGVAVRPKCRFECIGHTVLDVAHNPPAFQRLVEALQLHFPGERFHFITGFSKTKEKDACLALLQPLAQKISFVNTHAHFGSLAGGSIRDVLGTSPLREVVCGSFTLMAEARARLGICEPLDPK